MKKLVTFLALFFSLSLVVNLIPEQCNAQSKIKKSKLSKGEREALKDFEKRKEGKEVEKKTKDTSFLSQWQEKRLSKKDPTGMKLGLKKSMSIQDKKTRKRMKKNLRKAKRAKWK